MKILYVGQSSSGPFSGPSVHIQEVIRGLTGLGHTVNYVPCCQVSGSALRQLWLRLRFGLQVHKLLQQERPDWVYQREQLFDPFVALACRQSGVAYALEVNGLILRELGRSGARFWTMALARFCQGWALKSAKAVICPAANWMRILQADYGMRGEKFHFVQNGVCLDQFAPQTIAEARAKLGVSPDELIVGFLGSVYRNYDFEPIFRAIQIVRNEYPQLKVHIVGPGPRRQAVTELVSRLGLESVVTIKEAVPHDQAPDVIATFDLCLMPYCSEVLRENNGMFSMKLQEYTASARPLLAHDLPSSDSYADSNQFGWTFAPDDPAGALRALHAALRSNTERDRRGTVARRYAEGLSWTAVAQKIHQILTAS